MEKYTFIFEYKRGTYIKQVVAGSLEEATIKWASLIDDAEIPGFDDLKQKRLKEEIQKELPCKLNGIRLVSFTENRILFSSVKYSSNYTMKDFEFH